jgi:uncharacterized membrane protein YraQ (UPF0718 family)
MGLLLFLSLAALLVGPLLYRVTRGGVAATAVDAFALVGVAGIVLVHILPQSIALAGWMAIPVALFGLLGPGLLCGSGFFAGKNAGRITIPLAIAGIALHAILDGIALAGEPGDHGHHHGGDLLAFAVVLHRIPVGLGIWWLARPTYGRRAAVGLIGTIAVFTLLGFAFRESLVGGTSKTWFAFLQALIAGSLLHVVFKHPPSAPVEGRASPAGLRRASGVGGLAGVGLILAAGIWHQEWTSPEMVPTARETFLVLARESAPALLFAYLAVALVHALRLNLRKLLGQGGAWSQVLRGTFAGLPIPICSCGVIPLYRGLIQQRVPARAGLSFLVATPELGLAALFLSIQLLGAEITLARAASAIVLALLVGLVVGRFARVAPDVPLDRPVEEGKVPLGERIRSGLRYGFGDMVDDTAPWILVGIALAAMSEPMARPELLARLSPLLEVPIFALVGMPLYVCASGSTPLVAVLIAKGASPGAAIAFLLTGPATNLTTFGILGQLHGKRIAAAFASVVVVTTILLGYLVNALLPQAGASVPLMDPHEESGLLPWLLLAALGLLFVVSILRQGTRGFVAQVISPHGRAEHDGDDECGSCCGSHEHGQG